MHSCIHCCLWYLCWSSIYVVVTCTVCGLASFLVKSLVFLLIQYLCCCLWYSIWAGFFFGQTSCHLPSPTHFCPPVAAEDPEVMDRQKCLDALASLRHAKWFQVRTSLLCVVRGHVTFSSVSWMEAHLTNWLK